MLNHDVKNFRFIARESLKMDMCKRNINLTRSENNFLGYELKADGFLNSKTYFGCQSDWPDMLRYCRKLNVMVTLENDIAIVVSKNGIILDNRNLSKQLLKVVTAENVENAGKMSIQGTFLSMTNLNEKCSHSIFFNWKVNDELLKFVAKARLNILPTHYTTFIWNRENDPYCPFGCQKLESMAHVLNGCTAVFGNFYSRRHNRVVEKVASFLRVCCPCLRIASDKCAETLFPQLRNKLLEIPHRKPDIYVIDEVLKTCSILEVTVCYDKYLENAYEAKINRYESLVECLNRNGYATKLFVLCFGSLGCVKKDIWNHLTKFSDDKCKIKGILKWISISNIIGSNYIWRHRVKKLCVT